MSLFLLLYIAISPDIAKASDSSYLDELIKKASEK